MASMNTCDSPDLWVKIKAAKEGLMKDKHFSSKYKTSPVSSIEAAVKQVQRRPGLSEVPASKEVVKEVVLLNTTNNLNQCQKPAPSSPPANLAYCPNPTVNSTNTKRSRPMPCILCTRSEAIARRLISATPLAPNRTTLMSLEDPIDYASCIPSPLANEVNDLDSSESSWGRAAADTPGRALVTDVHKTQAALVKMSGTDESDVIVLPKRGGREAHNTPAQRAPTACKIPHEHFSKTQEPLPESAGSKVVRNTDERRVSQVSVQFSEDVHKGVAIPSDHELKEPTTTTEKENRRETAAEELARLRKEIVFNAHRGRFDDSPTASPEELTRCRDGPGTDRQSEAYHEIATLRLVSQDGIGDESYVGYSLVFTEAAQDADPEVLKADLESQMKLSRELYKKSPTAFPIRQDDEALILSPVPTEKHKKMLAKVRKSLAGIKSESTSDSKEKQPVQMLEKSWSDPIIVDWEYCPRCIDNEKPYRVWFQGWLESTIERKCVMDIFHQAFFNGTAHADGETSMFMLDMRNYVTQLGPTDKKARLHAHETAAGYCYNILLQNGKAEEAEEHRKRMERQRRVEYRHYEPLRSPSSPRANIYLRPVDINKDVPELRSIYNWYAQKSVSSPNTVSLDAGQVRQQIEICLNARLPFIVAVDRRSASNKHGGRILGYACAREFDGLHLASQFTAEMELYVRDGNMNQGIGKCLLDKLLEVCDSTYTPKGGYLFEATKDDRSAYYPGGRRKLARLIFTLCYVDCTEISGHKRVKKWLQEHAEFEEQGLLRGVRVKNNKLINVAYLVRTANGNSISNNWEP